MRAAWAAEALAADFGGPGADRIARTAQFLEEEMADSGIVVSRGGELQFWHLTFQEYLAAVAIAGKPDQEQIQLLFEQGKAYRPEWRETVLLLAGVLRVKQGKAKVDGVATAILDRAGSKLVPDSPQKGLPLYSDIPVDTVPWMKEIRDRLVGIWNAATEPTPESAVLITNFAFYYGDNDSPSPTGMAAFFPSLKPRAAILGDPMIGDLIYCLQTYDTVPRQI